MVRNLDRINPLKREKVRQGLQFVEDNNIETPVIDKIVIFGSSISQDCTEDSDIDLCIFSKYECNNAAYFRIRGRLARVINDKCDILKYDRLNDRFKAVVNKGVTVYER